MSRSLAAVAGATAIVLVVKLIQNSLVQRLPDPDTRYYARKLVTIGGWFACVLLVAVSSDIRNWSSGDTKSGPPCGA